MSRFRYVIADVFTDTPLAGQRGRRLHGRARDPRGPAPADRARDEPTPRRSSSTSPRARVTRGSGSSRRRESCRSPGTRFSARRSSSAAPLQLEEIRLETGAGLVPVGSSGTERAHRLWTDGAAAAEHRGRTRRRRAVGDPRRRRSELPVEVYDNGIRHVYVCLRFARKLSPALRPDLGRLVDRAALVCVNCFAGEGWRWKTRMFAPASGVAEDPATGSAAGPLALHLARHGRIAFGDEIEISQGVEVGRPSKLFARVDGSADDVRARRSRRLRRDGRARRAQRLNETPR